MRALYVHVIKGQRGGDASRVYGALIYDIRRGDTRHSSAAVSQLRLCFVLLLLLLCVTPSVQQAIVAGQLLLARFVLPREGHCPRARGRVAA